MFSFIISDAIGPKRSLNSLLSYIHIQTLSKAIMHFNEHTRSKKGGSSTERHTQCPIQSPFSGFVTVSMHT